MSRVGQANNYVYDVVNAYYLCPLPRSHVAQCVDQAGKGPRCNVLKIITKLALTPPTNAVTVKYIRSLAAAVMARSTPPGIAELLHMAVT